MQEMKKGHRRQVEEVLPEHAPTPFDGLTDRWVAVYVDGRDEMDVQDGLWDCLLDEELDLPDEIVRLYDDFAGETYN